MVAFSTARSALQKRGLLFLVEVRCKSDGGAWMLALYVTPNLPCDPLTLSIATLSFSFKFDRSVGS